MDTENLLIIHNTLYPNSNFLIEYEDKEKCIINYCKIKLCYQISESSIYFTICYDDNNMIKQDHFYRLLVNKNNLKDYFLNNQDDITEYILLICQLFQLVDTNYCTICFNELNVKGTGLISFCEINMDCKKKFYHLVTDSRVTEMYNTDSKVFEFLLNITINGISHPKGEQAYKPLPIIYNINDLDELKNFISNNRELEIAEQTKLFSIIVGCENDFQLYKKINPDTYCLLKNIVSNNYFSMSSRVNDSVTFIHINYSAEVENKFQKNYFLFHGSPIHSWYPIIKNGLKVMSGTTLQAHGVAYGNGIYFSDSFHFSLGYSSRIAGNYSVVGVFEILEDPVKYKKASNIYVVPDDKIILLRTLVLIKAGEKISTDITEYFTRELPLQKKLNKFGEGILKNKRLNSEYQKLISKEWIKNIVIQDQFLWLIEFIEIKKNIIIIELGFSNYPISPPSIKMRSDIIISGLIELDGSIKIKMIEPSEWKITTNLVEITKFLSTCFMESI